MSIIIDGVTIPNTADIIYDGVHLEKIICDGVVVWEKFVNLMELFEDDYTGRYMEWDMETTELQYRLSSIYSKEPIDLCGQIIKIDWMVSGIYPNKGMSSSCFIFEKAGDDSTHIDSYNVENLENNRYKLPLSGRAYLGISVSGSQQYSAAEIKPSQPGHAWIQSSTVEITVQYD